METGIAVTEDAGKTWRVSRDGLDIPMVHSIWTPRHFNLVMVGTPAGMYVSNDGCKSWTDTPLILQGEGAIRAEIGGIGYLTAYWMGRYHNILGTETCPIEWGRRKCRSSFFVIVAISTLKQSTRPIANALHCATFGLDVKTSRSSDCYTPNISSSLFTCFNNGFDHIACLEPMNTFKPFGLCSWVPNKGASTQ